MEVLFLPITNFDELSTVSEREEEKKPDNDYMYW
jgi:hypothetical protein